MKPARNTEVLQRKQGRLTRVIRRHALAAGGEPSGGSARYGPGLQAPHRGPGLDADPLPGPGKGFLPGPELAACARRGRGKDPFDEIDLEFYLDCIGGE